MSFANELLRLLLRLEVAAGGNACEKFMAGKMSVRGQGSGRYVSSYTDPAIGSVVVGLLEQLLSGEVTPILDVDSYYRNGKRWPMVGGRDNFHKMRLRLLKCHARYLPCEGDRDGSQYQRIGGGRIRSSTKQEE